MERCSWRLLSASQEVIKLAGHLARGLSWSRSGTTLLLSPLSIPEGKSPKQKEVVGVAVISEWHKKIHMFTSSPPKERLLLISPGCCQMTRKYSITTTEEAISLHRHQQNPVLANLPMPSQRLPHCQWTEASSEDEGWSHCVQTALPVRITSILLLLNPYHPLPRPPWL